MNNVQKFPWTTSQFHFYAFGRIPNVSKTFLARSSQWVQNKRQFDDWEEGRLLDCVGSAVCTVWLLWLKYSGTTSQFHFYAFGRIQTSLRPFLQEAASAKNGSITIERMEDYWICTVQFGSSDSLGGLFYYFDGNLEWHKSSVYKNFMLSFPISM